MDWQQEFIDSSQEICYLGKVDKNKAKERINKWTKYINLKSKKIKSFLFY